jgi:hypothetical protein
VTEGGLLGYPLQSDPASIKWLGESEAGGAELRGL